MIKLTVALMAALVVVIVGMIAREVSRRRSKIANMRDVPAIWEYMQTMSYDPEDEDNDIGRGWMQ